MIETPLAGRLGIEGDVDADPASGSVCIEGPVRPQEAVRKAPVRLVEEDTAAIAGQVREEVTPCQGKLIGLANVWRCLAQVEDGGVVPR